MTPIPETSNKKRVAYGEVELFEKSGVVGKWLKEIEKRLGDVRPSIKHIQNNAAKEFAKTGLPGKKEEDYKYTNIRQYLHEDFIARNGVPTIAEEKITPLFLKGAVNLVFINDKYAPHISDRRNAPEEVAIGDLYLTHNELHDTVISNFNKAAGELNNPMSLLNTALAGDGFYIYVPKNFVCKVPVHIVHIITGEPKSLFHPRNLVYLENGAELTLIESYHYVNENDAVFTNSVTEYFLEENAILENYVLQDDGSGTCHCDSRFYSVGTRAKANSVTISLGGKMIRNDTNMLLKGEHSEVHLNGLLIIKGEGHTDNHTMVEHRVPDCFSNELYKGIISDNGTGVFNGKIYVHPEAQKTNAYQSNKNILTGDKAVIYTKPQLEIYADDVRCTHGTSTGRLNDEALFYLESRGLNKELAQKVLLQAFAGEVVSTIKNEAFKEMVGRKVEKNIL